MLWLSYVFYGLMLVMGAAAFVLYRRAKEVRAWIWLLVALLGAAGLVVLIGGTTVPGLRGRMLGVMFFLFALDHLVQFLQSRRAGVPKGLHAFLAALWLLLGLVQFVELPGGGPS